MDVLSVMREKRRERHTPHHGIVKPYTAPKIAPAMTSMPTTPVMSIDVWIDSFSPCSAETTKRTTATMDVKKKKTQCDIQLMILMHTSG